MMVYLSSILVNEDTSGIELEILLTRTSTTDPLQS